MRPPGKWRGGGGRLSFERNHCLIWADMQSLCLPAHDNKHTTYRMM